MMCFDTLIGRDILFKHKIHIDTVKIKRCTNIAPKFIGAINWWSHADVNISKDIVSKNRNKLDELILKFKDTFATSKSDIERSSIGNHYIPLATPHRVARNYYRVPEALREEATKEINFMLKKG